MITFVDLTFSPSGEHAGAVVAKLARLEGVSSVMGEHDVMFRWKAPREFNDRLRAIHSALMGTGATYRVFTVEDSYQSMDPVPWIPPVESGPSHHPAYPEGKRETG
jgi:hypothetical protein